MRKHPYTALPNSDGIVGDGQTDLVLYGTVTLEALEK